MIQGRVDRKEGSGETATGKGRRTGKGWEWGGVLEVGRVDRKKGVGRGRWQLGGGQWEGGDEGVAKGRGRRRAR